MAGINGIYLPGWEFNRFLSDDPITPRNSALPSALFWNGSGPLWLFEKVYCTRESLDNERLASQELGWTASGIFEQLADGLGSSGRVLEAVDWQTLDDQTSDAVRSVHRRTRRNDLERQVRQWIYGANDSELELLTQAILQPVAASKNSIVAGSMSGLRNWLSPIGGSPGASLDDRNSELHDFLTKLSDPVTKTATGRTGLRLVRGPDEWDPIALKGQNQARREVEDPFIHDLQAGDGEYEGKHGYEPYIRRVATRRRAYEGIDGALRADWEHRYVRLLRLREVAHKHLWPKLHNDWLPALLDHNPVASKEFPKYIASALAMRHFANILDMTTSQVFGLIAIGLATTGVVDHPFLPLGASLAAISGGMTQFISSRPILTPDIAQLSLFYQKAFRVLRD